MGRSQFRFNFRQNGDGISECNQILAVGIAAGDSARQPLKVVDVFKIFFYVVAHQQIFVEFFYSAEA